MTDPVTNALAVQMEYGDEDLKRDIDQRIREIAYMVVMETTYDQGFFNTLISNNAGLFNNQVQRALREFINNPRQIY